MSSSQDNQSLCKRCHGDGRVYNYNRTVQNDEPIVIDCPDCKGTGTQSTQQDSVTILEDWDERPDGVYYLWKQPHEKGWHEKLTAYKQKPVVQYKILSHAEAAARGIIEPYKPMESERTPSQLEELQNGQ